MIAPRDIPGKMRGYDSSSGESSDEEASQPPKKIQRTFSPVAGDKFSICSFNLGIQQSTLESVKGWSRDGPKLKGIAQDVFDIHKVNVACFCEFGGHRHGPNSVPRIDVSKLMTDASVRIKGTVIQDAYCSAFDHTCSVKEQGIYEAHSGHKADMAWQILFVNTDMDVSEGSPAARSGAAQPAGSLAASGPSGAAQPAGGEEVAQIVVVIGNAHIVCGKKPPTIFQRKAIVKQFLDFLGGQALDLAADFRIVRVLVGDPNISHEVARQCASQADVVADGQKKLDRWVPVSTAHELSGDVMWCSGAIAKQKEIPIGTSYDHSGIRRDNHDAVAATLVVPFKDIAAGEPSGAAQPAGMPTAIEGDVQEEVEPEHWSPPWTL